jgi:hypothetical protein
MIKNKDMLRLPAPGDQAIVLFQRAQKIVLDERIDRPVAIALTVALAMAVGQRIPLRGIDRGQVFGDADGVIRQQTLSRQSRYFSASSAAMQPVPAEVTAWR